SLSVAVATKTRPTEYMKAIQEGQQLIAELNLAEAMRAFERATLLDPKPSLAYYYRGYINSLRQAVGEAQSNYLKGLEYNKIHYRCLQGLFNTLSLRKDDKGAYFVLRRIVRNFPISPERFLAVIRLAVKTGHYEDIEQYYRLFLELEVKNDDMIKYICAALITSGKHFFRMGDRVRAARHFNQAGVSCGSNENLLKEVVSLLMELNLPEDADKYLLRFSDETKETADFMSLDYWVLSGTRTLQATIDHGRKLIRARVFHPRIHETLIRALQVAGLGAPAEDLCVDALRRWPEQSETWRRLEESSSSSQV